MIVELSTFELPFVPSSRPADSDHCDSDASTSDRDELRKIFEALIPQEAIYLGSTESTVENSTTWSNEDHFYVMPWTQDGFQWAVFAITWDDNWARWEFRAIARCAGEGDWRIAAVAALEAAFDSWGMMDDEEEAEDLRAFLDSISEQVA